MSDNDQYARKEIARLTMQLALLEQRLKYAGDVIASPLAGQFTCDKCNSTFHDIDAAGCNDPNCPNGFHE